MGKGSKLKASRFRTYYKLKDLRQKTKPSDLGKKEQRNIKTSATRKMCSIDLYIDVIMQYKH